jgi:hypothetical protein
MLGDPRLECGRIPARRAQPMRRGLHLGSRDREVRRNRFHDALFRRPDCPDHRHGSISGNTLHVGAETHSVDGPIDSAAAIRVDRSLNLAQGTTGMPFVRALHGRAAAVTGVPLEITSARSVFRLRARPSGIAFMSRSL